MSRVAQPHKTPRGSLPTASLPTEKDTPSCQLAATDQKAPPEGSARGPHRGRQERRVAGNPFISSCAGSSAEPACLCAVFGVTVLGTTVERAGINTRRLRFAFLRLLCLMPRLTGRD